MKTIEQVNKISKDKIQSILDTKGIHANPSTMLLGIKDIKKFNSEDSKAKKILKCLSVDTKYQKDKEKVTAEYIKAVLELHNVLYHWGEDKNETSFIIPVKLENADRK